MIMMNTTHIYIYIHILTYTALLLIVSQRKNVLNGTSGISDRFRPLSQSPAVTSVVEDF